MYLIQIIAVMPLENVNRTAEKVRVFKQCPIFALTDFHSILCTPWKLYNVCFRHRVLGVDLKPRDFGRLLDLRRVNSPGLPYHG